jgi:RNA-directed DNA polymerase
VVSPVLANLFLHDGFDVWMTIEPPDLPWCRYADDGLVHCRTEAEAVAIKAALAARFAECRLEMHPDKTKIVDGKDGKRRRSYPNTKFDFVGYGFGPRVVRDRKSKRGFTSFGPQVSASSLKAMRQKVRELNLRKHTHGRLPDIARKLKELLQGWLNYYGRSCPSAMYPMWKYINATRVAWAMRKCKRYAGRKIQADQMIGSLATKRPRLFGHWRHGKADAFACPAQQRGRPSAIACRDCSAGHEQPPDAAVALLGDGAELFLAATGILPGRRPERGG